MQVNRWISIWIALIWLLAGCAYYNTLFNAKKNYNQAIKILRANPNKRVLPSKARTHFNATIEKCWKLIEIYSEKSKYADDALLYIIKSEYYLNHLAQAQVHAEQFLKKYPNSNLVPEALLWYGKVLLKRNRYEEAREQFIKAINATRDSAIRAEAYFALGEYSFRDGDYEIAVEYFQKALKEEPDEEYRAKLEFYLGESFFEQHKYPEAIKHYEKVTKYQPTVDIEFETQIKLARSKVLLGKLEESIDVLKKMLTAPRFDPYEAIIKTELGRIYQRKKDYLAAEQMYREALAGRSKKQGAAQAAFQLARLYETVYQNLDSAVTYYARVRRIEPSFDSLKIAESKRRYLKELKDLLNAIRRDEMLVYRLENDRYFRDSLYKAQRIDSLRKLYGLADPESLYQAQSNFLNQMIPEDSLRKMQEDSLKRALLDSLEQARRDSLARMAGFANLDPDSLRNLLIKQGKQAQQEEKERQSSRRPPLEKRKLPQIRQDLMQNRFHLAEFYLLKDRNLDSAAVHYQRFLETYQDSVLTPKALYSLYYIYTSPGHHDSLRADSLEKRILREYPNSVFAREILRRKPGYEEQVVQNWLEEQAHRLYLKAESLYFAQQVDSALSLYLAVAELDTTLEWSAKAMYAVAWIYEHDLNQPEKALQAYKQLLERYAVEGPYKEIARLKTTPIQFSTSASMPEAEETSPEEAPEVASVEEGSALQNGGQETQHATIPLNKIRWRRRRMLQHSNPDREILPGRP